MSESMDNAKLIEEINEIIGWAEGMDTGEDFLYILANDLYRIRIKLRDMKEELEHRIATGESNG